MKDRLGYSPKDTKLPQRYDLNFKKSPIKYVTYNSPSHPLPPTTHPLPLPPERRLLASTSLEFENLQKVNEETAALRQTMNNKLFARLQQTHALELEGQGKGKLTDFLRQTMGSNKSNRVYSDTLIPDNAYSGDPYNPPTLTPTAHNQKYLQGQRSRLRKATSSITDNASFTEYEKLSEKMSRNRQMIDQLKNANRQLKQGKEGKEGKEGRDFLKNVNHHRSPTYLHIDYNQKDKEEPLQFVKKTPKKQDPAFYFTPKIDKTKPQTRFNSSPLIQKAKSNEKKLDQPPTIGSFSTISTVKKKTSILSSSSKAMQVDDFIIDKKLGQGKFGTVNLVRHKRNNGLFALKKIPKQLIKANLMVEQLALQIRIQSCLKHSNILEMYGCFDDKTHLYIILQYMDGGTLYQRSKKERLSQKETSSIIRQITSAIDYLHDMGIAHRDLKPQNIVISSNVYKLCDFGWAAICNERRKTYCGTFDYVAPEILQGVEYDMTVDLWCLGVLTFQLLTGKAPFYHISRKETMKRILNVQNETLVFPEGMSEQARDFIDKLIRKDPTQRIKAGEALLHPFLAHAEEEL